MGINKPRLTTYNTSYKVTTQHIKNSGLFGDYNVGVFTSEADKVYLILLDAIKGRWDFPEPKKGSC